MAVLFEKTKYLTDKQFHYCPGCNHGIIHRLVAEVIDEMNLDGKVIGVAPVGCSVFAYDYLNCDMYEAAHGRAPAVATGIKRAAKDRLVFTYQGDGDLASLGTAEIVHAAHRGEKICTIFVNNAIYGMTGGQMAPTTLIGQKATTCPAGRSEEWSGLPIKMSEMLAAVPSSYYIERVAVNTVIQGSAAELMKKAMTAIHCDLKDRGLKSRILLQVHDELILEVPDGELDEVTALVRDRMENAAQLSVPLRAGIESGKRWGDMH